MRNFVSLLAVASGFAILLGGFGFSVLLGAFSSPSSPRQPVDSGYILSGVALIVAGLALPAPTTAAGKKPNPFRLAGILFGGLGLVIVSFVAFILWAFWIPSSR